MEHKLTVLQRIAEEFEVHHVTWTIGASALLYFKNITSTFNDLDILIKTEDIDITKDILLSMGTLKPSDPNLQYHTKYFLEFVVDDVEVDLMAGFAIVHEGVCHDCSLEEDQIIEYAELNGHKIPLQSVELWKQYYYWMGRDAKVKMIEEAMHRLSAR